jgi:hypothetical protein
MKIVASQKNIYLSFHYIVAAKNLKQMQFTSLLVVKKNPNSSAFIKPVSDMLLITQEGYR